MRRLFTSATAALLLAAALGCHHYAGVCDCGHDGGCCAPGLGLPGPVPGPVMKAEPIKAMPKAGDPGAGAPEK